MDHCLPTDNITTSTVPLLQTYEHLLITISHDNEHRLVRRVEVDVYPSYGPTSREYQPEEGASITDRQLDATLEVTEHQTNERPVDVGYRHEGEEATQPDGHGGNISDHRTPCANQHDNDITPGRTIGVIEHTKNTTDTALDNDTTSTTTQWSRTKKRHHTHAWQRIQRKRRMAQPTDGSKT